MWNPFKNLFWKKDIRERAKKVGVNIASSDGIDLETFWKRVNDSENSLRSRQNIIISLISLVISIFAVIIHLLK